MGRPKGSENKRSQKLLRKLEDDHKFVTDCQVDTDLEVLFPEMLRMINTEE